MRLLIPPMRRGKSRLGEKRRCEEDVTAFGWRTTYTTAGVGFMRWRLYIKSRHIVLMITNDSS